MIDHSTTIQLACRREAPGEARRFVVGALAVAGGEGRFPDAELLVSELVTNVVVHTPCAQVGVDVSTDARADSLRVAVRDSDPAPPQPQEPEPGRPGGRGLRIVDAVASAWGCERLDRGKEVWFVLCA